MQHRIDLDECVLMVEITDLTNTPPDYSSWDSPDDYYGCCELEFKVVSGIGYDEDGAVALAASELEQVGEQHADLIEELLWRIVDSAEDLEKLERAEARAARYAA